MAEKQIKLIEPTEELAEEYIAYAEEFRAVNEPFVYGELDKASGDAAALVGLWQDQVAGQGLPDGYVPCSRYWLVRGRRLLGSSRLRHRLTKTLENFGGHVGYEVRPSERNKGYATQLLAMTLEKARALGIGRILVTCDKDNIASQRMILKNGGVLDSESYSEQAGRITQRYLFELSAPKP